MADFAEALIASGVGTLADLKTTDFPALRLLLDRYTVNTNRRFGKDEPKQERGASALLDDRILEKVREHETETEGLLI